ncbi:G1/S-specific cyclin-E [Hyposmocoma kahamanoa]|uniref:G1/S-specific cyclin-E n=1 Tax=Hyposmocoma kahamanoa TaxID=1477025 RepID=UPI000E6D7EE1|nr:G1/S-specific cyclin-E [Hyposmocoma kahamanoa]XP_026319828.1 G1/S-specific cyclin-E [Hyposmocoma kahamanoa]
MAQNGSSDDSSEKRSTLKRKRSSTDDEVENMPPSKMSLKLEEELNDQPAQHVVVESSSCSSDDESSQLGNIEQPRSVFTDIDYNPDSLLSPPSLPELPNCVLSPLENVARGDSTPHTNKRSSTSKSQCPSTPKRKCPLPGLSWADPADVWKSMCECDTRAAMKRNPHMFDNHPSLQPRMRAILLDWLNEVCEVYKLHRETFHLTVDYVDRYLSNTVDIQKGRLQLIGITCLFVAAKVEEVYPPKIGEFAYVTDGACTTEEILLEELLILKIMSWSITPITTNSWLNMYMQLASEGRSAKRRLLGESDVGANALRGYTFVFPQYSSLEFVQCGQLIDLAVLHVDVNQYSYSSVAAAAMAHAFNKDLALRVSGFSWESLEPCYRWLAPFVQVVREEGAVCVVRGGDGEFVQRAAGLDLICPDLNADESHRIQSHNVTLDMFDKVYQHLIEQTNPEEEPSASTSQDVEHIYPPTPPQSDQKSPKTPTTKTPSTRHQTVPEELHTEIE